MKKGAYITSKVFQNFEFGTQETVFDQTLGNYVAIALVPQEVGLKLGQTFASSHAVYPFTSATITASNIVSALTALAKQGRAYFINKDVMATNGAETGYQDAEIYGNKATAKAVDLHQGVINVSTDKYVVNKSFFSLLRQNRPFDIYLFTNNTVTFLDYAVHGVTYSNIIQKAFNRDQHIIGGFDMNYRVSGSDNEFYPEAGVTMANILAPITFTFASPTTGGTGLTATANDGQTYQYAKTLAGAGTLTFALNPADAGVEIGCFKTDGSDLPVDFGTYDAVTKILTLPSSMPAGTYNYAVVAVNAVGVVGQILLKIKVS